MFIRLGISTYCLHLTKLEMVSLYNLQNVIKHKESDSLKVHRDSWSSVMQNPKQDN